MANIRYKELFKIDEDRIIIFFGIGLAFLLRFSLREFESGDYRNFIAPWYDYIRSNGGFHALSDIPSNYSPPYLYLLVIASFLFARLPDVFAFKLIAIFFDFVCAWFILKIIRLKYPESTLPLLAFFLTLFLPTVFLNSSFWGQADILYTTGLIACLYYLLREKETAALIAFSLAFSFKLQAIFLSPLLLILFLKRRISWKKLWIFPTTHLISLVPAWLAGRPMSDLLTIYLGQANFYRALTKNAPSLYQWLPNDLYDILMPAGLIGTVVFIFLLTLVVVKSSAPLTSTRLVFLATYSVMVMPFVLPKMHDRYFFPADVFSIVFAFYYPRFSFLPVIIGSVSLFSYFPFLFGREVISLSYLAIILLFTITFFSWHLAHEFRLKDF